MSYLGPTDNVGKKDYLKQTVGSEVSIFAIFWSVTVSHGQSHSVMVNHVQSPLVKVSHGLSKRSVLNCLELFRTV